MESKIIQQEKNLFLHREEFVIEFKSESNPSFDDVKKALGKDDELVVVKKIKSNFGRRTFTAEAVVYDSKEAKEKIETAPKKTKKKPEGSPVVEEKTAELGQPTEEAPVEEEKEETAEEAPVEEAKEDKTETKPEEDK